MSRRDMPAADDLPVLDSLGDLVRVVTESPERFVRFSHGPRHDGTDGGSRDPEAGVDMPGLSVTTVAPEPWWPRPPADWVARRLCQYDWLDDEQERFPWVLTGRVVGHGPDHEPLVVDVEPVARIGRQVLVEARERYHRCFQVAEDPRSGDSDQ